MRKVFFFLITLSLGFVAVAQEHDMAWYKNEYHRIYKDYVDNPENVEVMVQLASFYSQKDNPMLNLTLARTYVTDAEARYLAIVDDKKMYKEMNRLIKKKITIETIRALRDEITLQAAAFLVRNEDISLVELNSLATAFKNESSVLRLIDQRRASLLFREAQRTHTILGYRHFIEKYPATEEALTAEREATALAVRLLSNASTIGEVDELVKDGMGFDGVKRAANRRKATLEYADVRQKHTVEAYQAFLSKYPASDEYGDALEQLEHLQEVRLSQLKSSQELADFALQNSDSPLAEQAMQQLRNRIRMSHDQQTAHIYFKTFPLDEEYSNLYRLYYSWHADEGNADPILRFQKENPNFPYLASTYEDLRLARRKDSINLLRPYDESKLLEFASDVRFLTGRRVSLVALLRTMQAHITAKNWKEANERMDYFMLSFDEDYVEEYATLRQIINAPNNPNRAFVGEVVPSYNMTHATIHPTNGKLYYTMNTGSESSICVAQPAVGQSYKWKSAGAITFDNHPNKGVEFYNFYAKGNKMLFGYKGDIYTATRQADAWHVEGRLPAPVNTEYTDYDAFMLPDESGMLIASDRPDGHNYQTSGAYFHGDTALASDLYYIPHTAEGWGEPINLGIRVNTPYCDHSPVISNDLKTLYFISDGHVGLGYGDIFMATRKDINDWTSWSKAVNYGKEVNSAFREGSITMSPDEKRLYICSNRSGRYGCYSSATAHTPSQSYREVDIFSDMPQPISLVDLSAHRTVGEINAASLLLFKNKSYAAVPRASSECFMPAAVFSPAITGAVNLRSFDEMRSPSHEPLRALQFEKATAVLTPTAETELSNLALFLASHPHISKVYFFVYVPGSDSEKCWNLSYERSNSIQRFLKGKGIDPGRIIVSAMGNSNVETEEIVTILW